MQTCEGKGGLDACCQAWSWWQNTCHVQCLKDDDKEKLEVAIWQWPKIYSLSMAAEAGGRDNEGPWQPCWCYASQLKSKSVITSDLKVCFYT
jgi:hypothetical protein